MKREVPYYYVQCESCSYWFPSYDMCYYTTDLKWMCDACASIYNNW